MLNYLAFTFVIFTSLIGTFFVAKTIYGLFFCDDEAIVKTVHIDKNNNTMAEYLIRTACHCTSGTVLVEYDNNDEETAYIVENLALNNNRIKIKSKEV